MLADIQGISRLGLSYHSLPVINSTKMSIVSVLRKIESPKDQNLITQSYLQTRKPNQKKKNQNYATRCVIHAASIN